MHLAHFECLIDHHVIPISRVNNVYRYLLSLFGITSPTQIHGRYPLASMSSSCRLFYGYLCYHLVI